MSRVRGIFHESLHNISLVRRAEFDDASGGAYTDRTLSVFQVGGCCYGILIFTTWSTLLPRHTHTHTTSYVYGGADAEVYIRGGRRTTTYTGVCICGRMCTYACVHTRRSVLHTTSYVYGWRIGIRHRRWIWSPRWMMTPYLIPHIDDPRSFCGLAIEDEFLCPPHNIFSWCEHTYSCTNLWKNTPATIWFLA